MTTLDQPPLSIADFPLTREQLAEWDGLCLEFVYKLLWAHPTGDILYVENLPQSHRWEYHAALVLDGFVFDAWHPTTRLPPAEYIRAVFGEGVSWEILGRVGKVVRREN